jgi:hypothetical protein
MRVDCPKCGKSIVIPTVRPAVVRKQVSIRVPSSSHNQPTATLSSRPPTASAAAIWSLILGILSLFCLGPLTGIPAIICGHSARTNIRHSSGSLNGAGMALAGLILGYITTVIFVIVFVFGIMGSIAVPSFMKARSTSQQKACINNLRQIEAGKEQWALAEKKPQGADADESAVNQYMRVIPVCPAGGVYTYGRIGEDARCSVDGHVLQ